MGFNIDKTPASSEIQGLGYVTNATNSLHINSFSLAGSGGKQNFTLTASAAIQDAASINLVRFSGVANSDVNNQWCLLNGAIYFNNSSNASIGAVLQRTSSGQSLIIQFLNGAISPVTVPAIDVTIRSYFYTASWN